jgi:hypothetical protein
MGLLTKTPKTCIIDLDELRHMARRAAREAARNTESGDYETAEWAMGQLSGLMDVYRMCIGEGNADEWLLSSEDGARQLREALDQAK